MDVWCNNLSRKSKPLNSLIAEEHPWLNLLKENQYIQSYVDQLHIWIRQFEPILSIKQQLSDLQINSRIPKEFPLISVQLSRLSTDIKTRLEISDFSEQDFKHTFLLFQDSITDQITLTDASRQYIDPTCKSVRDFSSKITAYKQWLEKVMFLVLCFNTQKTDLSESILNDFLALLNGIVCASTISRIRLRHQPKIDSVSFVEIPRNTPIKILGAPIDQHWVKVNVQLDGTSSEGYLQLAYIVKF